MRFMAASIAAISRSRTVAASARSASRSRSIVSVTFCFFIISSVSRSKATNRAAAWQPLGSDQCRHDSKIIQGRFCDQMADVLSAWPSSTPCPTWLQAPNAPRMYNFMPGSDKTTGGASLQTPRDKDTEQRRGATCLAAVVILPRALTRFIAPHDCLLMSCFHHSDTQPPGSMIGPMTDPAVILIRKQATQHCDGYELRPVFHL